MERTSIRKRQVESRSPSAFSSLKDVYSKSLAVDRGATVRPRVGRQKSESETRQADPRQCWRSLRLQVEMLASGG